MQSLFHPNTSIPDHPIQLGDDLQRENLIRLKLVDPQVTDGHDQQLDFSSLPGQVGRDWAVFFRRRVLAWHQIEPFTIMKFRQGECDEQMLPNGSIRTGGLQREMRGIDAALAARYPVNIHTLYTSSTDGTPYVLSDPSWRGQVTIHPVKFKSAALRENLIRIHSLIGQISPDIVHLYHPDNSLDAAIINSLPKDVGIVASYHGAPSREIPPGIIGTRRSYLSKFYNRYLQYRERSNSIPALIQTVWDSTLFVHRRLSRSTTIPKAVAAHGRGEYQKYNFSAVSVAGQATLRSIPSIVVHPPVDSNFFSPAQVSQERKLAMRATLGIPDDRPILLYHARFSTEKGQVFLPSVIAELKKMYNGKFSVVLIGPECETDICARVRTEVGRYNTTEQFILVDGRPQSFIRDALAISNVCLFPTFNEGLGLTAVEAQLMEVPVVAHNVGGVSEAVKDHYTGRLVEVGNRHQFAAAIAGLLQAPQLLAEYGINGRRLMMQEFNPQAIAQKAMEFLYLPQLLNSKKLSL